MLRSLTFTAVAALMAGPVMADGVNYARLSYDFTNYDDDAGGEADIGLFQGDVEYELGQVLLSAQILSITTDFGSSATNNAFGAAGAYMITPEALVGIGLFGTDPEFGDETNGFEVFGQYETAQFGVGIDITQFDVDEDNITTTLYGEAEVVPAVVLGASLQNDSEFDGTRYVLSAEYDDGPIFGRGYINGDSEFEGGIFGVRGDYEFTPQIRASAAYTTTYGDDYFDNSAFTVGGGYQVIDDLWVDANFGIIDLETASDDINRFQIAITYEMGDRKRIDTRFDQASIDDLQAGFGAGF